MFELADRLIGIFKTNDITKCLTFAKNKDEENEKEMENNNMKNNNKSKK